MTLSFLLMSTPSLGKYDGHIHLDDNSLTFAEKAISIKNIETSNKKSKVISTAEILLS